jgi:hypothetical protein
MHKLVLQIPETAAADLAAMAIEAGFPNTQSLARSLLLAVLADDRAQHEQRHAPQMTQDASPAPPPSHSRTSQYRRHHPPAESDRPKNGIATAAAQNRF